jgi:hypothetical protein
MRSASRARAEGREPRCRTCRFPIPKMSDEERHRLEVWWCLRLPAGELAEIARGIWG